MNLAKFPRRGYVTAPTPIEPLPRLSKSLGGKVNLWMKRDDLLPGTAGGNKTRKLDFCMADALKQGADTVITCGAVQSNHCRLTLAWAVKEGMPCHLVLEERVKGSFKPEASGNNFLFDLLGVAGVTVVPGGTNMMGAMQAVAERLRASGRKPYIIPGGASNPIGATGYVACAQETQEQLFHMGLAIDCMVVPSGSAGTHSGIVVGMRGCNANIPVVGINVSRTKEAQEQLVRKLSGETAERVGVRGGIPDDDVTCFGDYVGAGYSLPTEGMVEAVRLLASLEAVLLDPVYSGKAMAGCIDLVRKGYFPEGSNVLFLHTGGSPALYAYRDVLASGYDAERNG